MGKSGNGLAEAAFYSVPIVVTHSANDIEKRIAAHYVDTIKDAVCIFKLKDALDFVQDAIQGKGKYAELASVKVDRALFGSEKIADQIYEQIVKKYGKQADDSPESN